MDMLWNFYHFLTIIVTVVVASSTTNEVQYCRHTQRRVPTNVNYLFELQGKLIDEIVHRLMHQSKDEKINSKVTLIESSWRDMRVKWILLVFSWCKLRCSNKIVRRSSTVAYLPSTGHYSIRYCYQFILQKWLDAVLCSHFVCRCVARAQPIWSFWFSSMKIRPVRRRSQPIRHNQCSTKKSYTLYEFSLN